MQTIRRNLTYANVMATVAVFLALGGSAIALSKNSVGTRQLKKNAVTTKKIKNNAVTAAKIRSGSIGGGKLADGSIGIAQVNASLHLLCRNGTQYLMGGCIENNPRGTLPYGNAQVACQDSGGRLPNPSELFTLAKRGVVFGARELTDVLTLEGANAFSETVFSGGNFIQFEDTDNPTQFRCVFDPTG